MELEKILEEIAQLRRKASENGNFNVAAAYENSMEIIRKHMNDGWIPVEERLPIPNKEVWVTVKRNGKVFTGTDGMTEKGNFWNYEKENILAWKEKDIIPGSYRPEVTKP